MVTGCALGSTSLVQNEQYLCVAKTVVWTTSTEDGNKISGRNYDGADSKYLFSHNDGVWQARGLGEGSWQFDHCNLSGLLCEARAPEHNPADAIFAGAISRNPDSGIFYATGVEGDASASHVFTVAGTCSQYLISF